MAYEAEVVRPTDRRVGGEPVSVSAASLLAALLCIQAGLLAVGLSRTSESLVGDEFGYVKRAREIREAGALPKGTPRELDAERGHAWELSTDARPPGYPVFVAVASRGNFEPRLLRTKVALVQFAAVCLAIAAAFWAVAPRLGGRRQMFAAAILGGNPWVFEYVASIYPDSITASLTLGGLLCLWRSACRRRPLLLFTGSALLGSTLLFRPEMIVIAAVLIGGTLVIARPFTLPLATAAALGFLVPVSTQYAYRVHFTGDLVTSIFAPWRTGSMGAIRWAGTWVGTEHETFHDVVFRVADGEEPVFPPRSYSTPFERQVLEFIRVQLQENGRNSEVVDTAFRKLAAYRKNEMFFRAVVLPKLSRMALLWVNTNTNSQLLTTLASWHPVPRKALLGAILVARFTVLLAFACALVLMARARGGGGHRGWESLALLCVTLIVARTLLIGAVLDLIEHRYVLQSWLPLLMVALAALAPQTGIRRLPDPG